MYLLPCRYLFPFYGFQDHLYAQAPNFFGHVFDSCSSYLAGVGISVPIVIRDPIIM